MRLCIYQIVLSLSKVSTYAAMNEVQLFIQEVFPRASQAVIQTPEAWIVTEDENQGGEYFLKFDKVNINLPFFS